MNQLYFHITAGAQFDIASLHPDQLYSHDLVRLPNGDKVGVAWAFNSQARKQLEGADGVTVAPPMHRPLKEQHLRAFAHASVQDGDTPYELGEKLHDLHKMPYFHPEEHPY